MKVERFAGALHLSSSRAFEYSRKISSVAFHRSDAHPDDISNSGNLKDDVGLLSNEHMSRKSVESW